MKVLLVLLILAGCAQQTVVAPVPAPLAAVDPGQRAQDAIKLYGIAKGLASVAAIADPSLASSFDADVAVTDPLVVRLRAALRNAKLNAAAIQSLTAQISAQTNALTLRSASSVEIVPAKE